MKSVNLLLLIAILVTMFGCATVPKPVVQKINPATPNISPSFNEDQQRTLKRVVAIARFSNETNYGKGVYLNNDNTLGKQAMDIFSTKMVNTGKFIMLERSDLEFLNNEADFSGNKAPDIPADFLVIGSITDFGRKNTGKVGAFSRSQKQTAYAKVHIRLVNVKTGQIIYGEEGSGEAYSEAGTVLGMGAQQGYDTTLNDQAIEAAIGKLINNIINNLLNIPWKSYVLSEVDGFWVIAGGKSQGIKVGDEYQVMQKGTTVINPQTNLPIELPGKNIATIKVVQLLGTSTQDEVSYCELINGKIVESDISKYYVQEMTKQ